MGITHEWDGTVLIVTSDSGTSSADLKGDKGDTGIRGPQGVKGNTGIVDYSALKDYATQEYVDNKVAEAQLPDKEVDLNGLYTKSEANKTFANALKGSKVGEAAVAAKDVSPVEHEVGIKVSSKNLFDVAANCAVDNIYSSNSVTYDGDIITTNFQSGILYINNKKKVVYPAGTYTITIFPVSENIALGFWTYDSKGGSEKFVSISNTTFSTPKSVTITYDYDFAIGISGISIGYGNHSFKVQIEKGSTATAYTPYVEDISQTSISVGGKNLFNLETLVEKVINREGSINNSNYYVVSIPFKPNTQYYLKCNGTRVTSGGVTLASIKYEVSTSISSGIGIANTSWSAGRALTTDETGNIYFGFSGGAAPSEAVIRTQFEAAMLQIEEGATATEYEPYTGVEYPVTADGTVVGVKSIYPSMSFASDSTGTMIEVEYNKDTNKVIESLINAIISLGGNV